MTKNIRNHVLCLRIYLMHAFLVVQASISLHQQQLILAWRVLHFSLKLQQQTKFYLCIEKSTTPNWKVTVYEVGIFCGVLVPGIWLLGRFYAAHTFLAGEVLFSVLKTHPGRWIFIQRPQSCLLYNFRQCNHTNMSSLIIVDASGSLIQSVSFIYLFFLFCIVYSTRMWSFSWSKYLHFNQEIRHKINVMSECPRDMGTQPKYKSRINIIEKIKKCWSW